MPFDPSLPVNSTQVRAEELRGQFNGLHDLITALSAISGAVVDSTNTLPPGNYATANVSLTGGVLHFTFAIPAGENGPMGTSGEVAFSDLSNAISTTSNNSNSVATLDSGFGDPDLETMRQKINELILALRR